MFSPQIYDSGDGLWQEIEAQYSQQAEDFQRAWRGSFVGAAHGRPRAPGSQGESFEMMVEHLTYAISQPGFKMKIFAKTGPPHPFSSIFQFFARSHMGLKSNISLFFGQLQWRFTNYIG